MERLPDSWTPRRRLRAAINLAWSTVDAPSVVAFVSPLLDVSPDLERARVLLERVQALPYRPDPPGEWVQTSAETVARGGDCEDLGALLVVSARVVALPARLLWLFQPSLTLDHVTAQVFAGGAWRWAEPTISARLGESPYVAAGRLGTHATLGGKVQQ